jgi:hypothetical protein
MRKLLSISILLVIPLFAEAAIKVGGSATPFSCKDLLLDSSDEKIRALQKIRDNKRLEELRKFIKTLDSSPLHLQFVDLIVEATSSFYIESKQRTRLPELAKIIMFGEFEGTDELHDLFVKAVKTLYRLKNEIPMRNGRSYPPPTLDSFHVLSDVIDAMIVRSVEDQIRVDIQKENRSTRVYYQHQWGGVTAGDYMSTPLDIVLRLAPEIPKNGIVRMVDVGSCHGVPDLILAALRPNLQIVGYELVKAKVDAANRVAESLGLSNVRFIEQDLGAKDFRLGENDFPSETTDIYYFYNPTYRNILAKSAADIRKACGECKILSIEGYKRWVWVDQIFEDKGFERTVYRDKGYTVLTPPQP